MTFVPHQEQKWSAMKTIISNVFYRKKIINDKRVDQNIYLNVIPDDIFGILQRLISPVVYCYWDILTNNSPNIAYKHGAVGVNWLTTLVPANLINSYSKYMP